MENQSFTLAQLRTLHAIATVLAKPGEVETVLHDTLHILAEQLGMKRGAVAILRRDLQEIHTLARVGMEDERQDPVVLRLGEGITGRVVKYGKPIAVPRLDREPLFLDRSGSRRQLNRADLAFLCVPIKYGKEVVGSLSVDRVATDETELADEIRFLESVVELIASRVESRRVAEENRWLREGAGLSGASGLIYGASPAIRQVRALVAQVADSKTTVLLTGETGVGKGLVARAIHLSSPRRDQPFVKVNCGAIPENLIESELFGHEKGAFTGATQTRIGRFESADGGTIFLDEVGELPAQSQVKLLRVLQEREFERVGGQRTIKVNTRLISATNRDLEQEVAAGKFRTDLFYRLHVFPIHVPPLHERGADVMMLADRFTKLYAEELGKEVNRIDTPAIDMLMAYHWPGNVRELENVIERAVLMSTDGVIHGHLLPPSLQMKAVEGRTKRRGKFEQLVAAYEMELIVDALKDAEGSQTRAAYLLGTTKRIIQYKVNKYGLDYRKFRQKPRLDRSED
ncbi:MAG: sigma 54-interacting transcriptional regulator [Myxococcales bacterium]|nr:sigma 54-interacting transcriptional regulator [Myxococcales bacterium]